MKVEYDMTPEDSEHLHEYLWKTSPTDQIVYGVLRVAGPITFLGGAVLNSVLSGDLLWSVCFWIGCIAGSVYYVVSLPSSIRRARNKLVRKRIGEGRNRAVYCHHTIEIDSEGLTEVTEFNSSHYTWLGIEKVAGDGATMFIFTSRAGSFVINRRAFASENEADAFFNAASTWHRDAQEAAPIV